jgi:hypothetical protein
MEFTKQIRFDLDDELYDWLNETYPAGNRAAIIREALQEKRNRKKISNEQLSNRMKKLDNLDTEVVHKTAVDIEFTKLIFSLLPHFVWRVSF